MSIKLVKFPTPALLGNLVLKTLDSQLFTDEEKVALNIVCHLANVVLTALPQEIATPMIMQAVAQAQSAHLRHEVENETLPNFDFKLPEN